MSLVCSTNQPIFNSKTLVGYVAPDAPSPGPANEHSVLTTQVDAGLVSLYSASQAQNDQNVGWAVRERLPLYSATGSDVSSLTGTAASATEDTITDMREKMQMDEGQQFTAASAQKLSVLAKYI